MASILRVFSCSFMDCSPWGKPAVILRGSSGEAQEARDCDCKLTPSEGGIQVVAQGCSLIWRLSWFRGHECTPDPKKLCNVIHIYCFGVVSYAAMGCTTGMRMLTDRGGRCQRHTCFVEENKSVFNIQICGEEVGQITHGNQGLSRSKGNDIT